MKKWNALTARLSKVVAILTCALAAIAAASQFGFAADEFQDLVNRIPRSANVVLLLNMEKAKNSPLGVKRNWRAKVEDAFESGLAMVPPQATRFVLASEIDFDFMEPIWQAAVIELNENLPIKEIEQMRPGAVDTIEGLPAIARPNDTYIVELAGKLAGAMAPANRQAVVRWIREMRRSPPLPLSAYLEKAAVYSDKTGSEIIIAIDLDGEFSFERVGKYLKSKQKLLDEWGADLVKLTRLLSGVEGVRIGVRMGEEPTAKIAIDLREDASMTAPYAKALILQIMADRGGAIDDLQSWTAKVEGREISLIGKLSRSGLRRLMSVVDSPAPDAPSAEKQVSPGELQALQAKNSLQHFKSVTGMAGDLKEDMKNSKTLAASSLWFDKYARRIEKLPMLNVDEAVLNYSAFVANQLRQASLAVKTMGIQSGARSGQITNNDISASAGTRWGSYGAYGPVVYGYDPMGVAKAKEAEHRAIRAEEKGIAATDVQQIRQAIIAATADTRRKMTQKYQIQF